jgi:hypothetical protein
MNQTGILQLTSRYLNSGTGDAYPGSVSGSSTQRLGQLGAVAFLSFAEAQKRSDPAVTQSLNGGRYQYVQFASDGTNYALGQILYWKDETNYIVTNVAPISTSKKIAGICLTAVTQGNYWVMQTSGVAWVQYRATVTSTAAEAFVHALVNTNTADAEADATNVTATFAGTYIGTAKSAPANGAIGTVFLKNIPWVE